MSAQYDNGPHQTAAVRQVARLLRETPAFHQLDPTTQRALSASLSTINRYLSDDSDGAATPLAYQMAPDLRAALAPHPSQQEADGAGSGQAQPATQSGATTGTTTSAPSQSTTGRVGDVGRATLNAIDFPQFVASLIQGTFQAIVDASIQQMEAYAVLLKNVAQTVDQFMTDNVSDSTARDYLADQYDGVLTRDTAGGLPRLKVNPNAPPDAEMPSFFKDLGFQSPADLDDKAIDETVIPAARRNLAQQRQQTLATMVLMGINRVVVDDGEIMAKLQFHIDAAETAQIRFDQKKTTAGNIAARAGRSPFTANAIMVNTTSLNAQSDINIRTDLTGQVKVHFRSETFPLERFADSAAIQLINQNAKVPQPLPTASAPAPTGTSAASTAPAPAAPAPTPTAQSLAVTDPWAPEPRR